MGRCFARITINPKIKVAIKAHKKVSFSHKLLESHYWDALEKDWRIVVPNDLAVKGKILEEVHVVPYAAIWVT